MARVPSSWVPYTCSPGMFGGFSAMLAQASSDGYTNFSGDDVQLTCTASNRTGVLAFHATGSSWVAGSGFLLVTAYLCDESGTEACAVASTYRSLKLI